MSVSRLIAIPGRDLDEEGSLSADRQEALRDRPEEGRVLLLKRVEEDVASEVDHRSQSLRPFCASRPVSDSIARMAATEATSMSRCSPPR